MKNVNQKVGNAGHDEKLRTGTNEDVQRTTRQNAEILCGECQAHRKHDDAEDDGLCRSTNPHEEVGHEKCNHCDGSDEKGGMGGEPAAHVLE